MVVVVGGGGGGSGVLVYSTVAETNVCTLPFHIIITPTPLPPVHTLYDRPGYMGVKKRKFVCGY